MGKGLFKLLEYLFLFFVEVEVAFYFVDGAVHSFFFVVGGVVIYFVAGFFCHENFKRAL